MPAPACSAGSSTTSRRDPHLRTALDDSVMTTVALPHGRELELAVPEYGPGPWPVVVYLHGGGFVSGSHRAADNPIAQLVVETLLPRGIAVAAAEYRLADQASYPAPVDDAAAAVSWLRVHGSRHGLDGARIAAWGDSAGAT